MKSLTWGGFGLRLLFATLLVFGTYNPSGYSLISWVILVLEGSEPLTPWIALAAIVVIIGWTIYLRATLRSLGTIGLILAAVLISVLIWILIYLDIISLDSQAALTWIIEIFLAILLGVGMSWSHIRRRMSGQVDVDDVDG